LENFHQWLAHYGNGGMKAELADILNLMGTARWNVKVRWQLYMAGLPPEQRPNCSETWMLIPNFWDHSELKRINDMAVRAGWTDLPFPYVRDLPADNGERFFSEYFQQQKSRSGLQDHPLNDLCPCPQCKTNLSTPRMHGTQNTTAATVTRARVIPATRVAPVTPRGAVMHQTHQQLPHLLPIMPLQHVFQRPPGDPFPWHTARLPWPIPNTRPKPQHQVCCIPYYNWTMQKGIVKGRPPHDHNVCPIWLDRKKNNT